MKTSKMEMVTRIFCDNCGKELTNNNRVGSDNLDFCLRPFLDTGMYCMDAYNMRLKLNEQRPSQTISA